MNYEGIAISVAITLWGFWEYREREIRHRKALLDLQKNIEVKTGNPPSWSKVTTTVITSILLLIVIVGGMIFVNKIGLHYGKSLFVWLMELMFVAFLLLMMAMRDARILRKG
ncbi:MAG: hypothetical protein M1470_07905 [Bacteroidetes bacterium]|nr:hypothetical protein [Bacteroidota bacterium]MCL5738495.1 hypothetical protein [Bacteroidota bacterium]